MGLLKNYYSLHQSLQIKDGSALTCGLYLSAVESNTDSSSDNSSIKGEGRKVKMTNVKLLVTVYQEIRAKENIRNLRMGS